MKYYWILLISMLISGLIFMVLVNKMGWNKRLWEKISHKVNRRYFIFLWLLAIVLVQILLQVILGALQMSMASQQLLQGIVLGVLIGFSPSYTMNK